MIPIVELGEPSHVLECPHPGCGHRTGRYFDQREAQRSLDNHMYYRHIATYKAGQCPDVRDRDF